MSDANVYEVLAEYQREGADGWSVQTTQGHRDLSQVSKELQRWAEKFRSRFKLQIPTVTLRFARLRWNCLGHFNPSHNDFGLRNEIAIDLGHIVTCQAAGRWWEVLATLLHEQLHYWQQLNGRPSKPGPGNYHNVEYRATAGGLGITVSDRGVNEGYDPDGPFLRYLREEGVHVPSSRVAPAPRKAVVGSKLKKWSCGCCNVRVAVADFHARCMRCLRDFVRCP